MKGNAPFRSQAARYRMEFGYQHLQCGDRLLGVRALAHAWALQPRCSRARAIAALDVTGWRSALACGMARFA